MPDHPCATPFGSRPFTRRFAAPVRSLQLLAWACAAVIAAPARAEEPIATDRPDFVESADVVGKGRVQIETSFAEDRTHRDGVRTRLRGTPTLLRLGVSEVMELRLETEGRQWLRVSGAGQDERVSGYADVSVGMKWRLAEGDEEKGTPSLAWLLHADLDTGSGPFRGSGTRPSLRGVAEWELPGGWSLGVMPGVFQERNDSGQRYVGWLAAAVVGKNLTDAWRVFGEVAAQQLASRRNGGNVISLDVGTAYLINPDWQIDLAVSRGLTRQTPNWSWTTGLSTRF